MISKPYSKKNKLFILARLKYLATSSPSVDRSTLSPDALKRLRRKREQLIFGDLKEALGDEIMDACASFDEELFLTLCELASALLLFVDQVDTLRAALECQLVLCDVFRHFPAELREKLTKAALAQKEGL